MSLWLLTGRKSLYKIRDALILEISNSEVNSEGTVYQLSAFRISGVAF